MRKTKIVATLGPASKGQEMVLRLCKAGVNVFRLNFSHGTHEEHYEHIENIKNADVPAALMLDTQGPEVRTGLVEGEVELIKGKELILTGEEILGTCERISVSYPNLAKEIEKGKIILLADGLIELRVLETKGKEIRCKILNGGKLTSRKGVNLPGTKLNLPPMTAKDEEDIKFGIAHEIDFIAASFIRKAEDVIAIRRVLEENYSQAQIISKIENQEGVNNIDEIIEVSDGIMVARGDMGVELPAEKVPVIQKQIIHSCNRAGKPVITATQMLESMINNPRPTRAEASDIANAILDGTDATMLSGETAMGKYPVESVETMARIARETENSLPYKINVFEGQKEKMPSTVTDAVSYATCATANDLKASAIITSTRSGHTARMVSKYRPKSQIIAATPNHQVLRQLMLSWGVYPLFVEGTGDTDAIIDSSVKGALQAGLINSGDLVVITTGAPAGIQGTTNLMKVHTVGEIWARGTGIGRSSAVGSLKLAQTAEEAIRKVEKGDILVAFETDKDYMPALEKISGLITEEAGLTSHGAIVGLNLGIPVIVGVEDALSRLEDGEMATIDGLRGLIYRGEAKVL